MRHPRKTDPMSRAPGIIARQRSIRHRPSIPRAPMSSGSRLNGVTEDGIADTGRRLFALYRGGEYGAAMRLAQAAVPAFPGLGHDYPPDFDERLLGIMRSVATSARAAE